MGDQVEGVLTFGAEYIPIHFVVVDLTKGEVLNLNRHHKFI